MKNNKLGFISGLVGIIMLALIMTLGVMFMFKYTGSTTGNISLYNYIQDSGKSTFVLDDETAKLEFSEKNDEYASHLLISNERINRTEDSQNYSLIILISGMVLIGGFLFSLACEILSMFEYYKRKVKVLAMISRVLILALSVVLVISMPLYINSLASGLEEYFKLGFSVYLLPILSLLNVVLFFIFNGQLNKKGK